MSEFEAEADVVDEARLLVEVAEVAGSVGCLVFFLEGIASQLIKGLLDLIGVLITVQLVVGAQSIPKIMSVSTPKFAC